MVKLVVLFKQITKTSDFDLHFMRIRDHLMKMPGVQDCHVGQVLGSPMGQATFHRVVELEFESFEALDAALTSPQGVVAGKALIGFAGNNAEIMFVDMDPADAAKALTPKDLQAYLDKNEIPAEIVMPGQPTPTVPAAAKALGVEPDQIVKTVLFLVDGRPFVVYGCGTRRVDMSKLAGRLNVSRKKVQLANADDVLEITGYPVGTVPPFGFKTERIPAFMDPAVQAYEVIYAGGGGGDALLKMTSADLLRITQADVAPMLQEDLVADPEVVSANSDAVSEQAADDAAAPESES